MPPATNGCVGPAPSDLKVIVVDIDRASIDALGTWPWPQARLVESSQSQWGFA
jgi:adenylate cyclase